MTYWHRGVLLEEQLPKPPAPEEHSWAIGRPLRELSEGDRVLCSDGAGGAFGNRPRYRRVGWAAAVMSHEGVMQGAIFGTLGGEQRQQTVPRAE